uniref:Uncharacterized protein n=1 Tax=Globodera rostochiensis TaxID=31243 RepID=A0A914I4D6_GLORO
MAIKDRSEDCYLSIILRSRNSIFLFTSFHNRSVSQLMDIDDQCRVAADSIRATIKAYTGDVALIEAKRFYEEIANFANTHLPVANFGQLDKNIFDKPFMHSSKEASWSCSTDS